MLVDLPLKKTIKKILLFTTFYPRKNLMVKDEDEELSSVIMKAMKTSQSSYENLEVIEGVQSPDQASMMKVQYEGSLFGENST